MLGVNEKPPFQSPHLHTHTQTHIYSILLLVLYNPRMAKIKKNKKLLEPLSTRRNNTSKKKKQFFHICSS